MGITWHGDSDERPERPPTTKDILAYGFLFGAVLAIVIIICFFTGP